MFSKLTLTPKLVLLFLVFGLVPMASLGWVAYSATEQIEENIPRNFETVAVTLADKIDRNLFERYGDVQAFALNHAIRDRGDWYRVGEENSAIVEAMNQYVDTYDIYYLTILVDPNGRVIATNSKDADGAPIDTRFLYDENFAGSAWFGAVSSGNFTRRMPFTAPGNDISDGTYIEHLHLDGHVKRAYPGDGGLALGFSAPVYENGEVIAYWSNRTKFSLVEDIFKATYQEVKASGFAGTELTLLDEDGRIIIDYDPTRTGSEEIAHDFQTIMNFNLADAGVPVAQQAVAGQTGGTWAFHARKKITQAAGFTHLQGALGYPGMNWSVLARTPRDEAIADILDTRTRIFIMGGIFIAFIAVLGVLIGRKAVQPITHMVAAAGEIAQGNLRQQPLSVRSADELGQLSTSFNEMLGSLGKLAGQAQYIARDELDNPALDEQVPGDLGEAFTEMVAKLKGMAGQASHIAAGDLYNSELRTDGTGTLGTSMATMVRNLRQQTEEREKLQKEVEAQAAEAKAQGEEAEAQKQHVLAVAGRVLGASDDVAASTEELSRTASNLSQTSEGQQRTVESVAAAVEELASSAEGEAQSVDELARLVTENSAALNELAASITAVTQNSEQMSHTVVSNSSAIEELAASIQTQAEGASQANQTAQQASQVAQEGATVVRQAIEAIERIADRVRSSSSTIQELGKSSAQISTIVAVINDIADQTNLLALNAAIEAARAGEQGKGFMVVADEVRKLAERTSQATQEIDQMIGKIQTDTQEVVTSMEEGMGEVEQGTELAAKSGEALGQIGDGVERVNSLMGQLTEASREQATTSDEIVRATAEMSELVQQVASAMGEQAQAVEVVSQGSEEMQSQVDQVANSVREQTQTTGEVARSMEDVNQAAAGALSASREMSQSTGELAQQAEQLKTLANSFEDGRGDASSGTNGEVADGALHEN